MMNRNMDFVYQVLYIRIKFLKITDADREMCWC